ncbi:MAG: hypothetical protein KQH63_18035 [Desulfobulbaceae bacterium]|nr:hypothetical protein [Desulfobulbaceae bacterium]
MKGLIDSTLREGEQTPGVFFSLPDKIKIATLLSKVGIEEIELGIATPYNTDLPQLIKSCRSLPAPPRLALWCRCTAPDIMHAAALGPDVLSLSIPASDLHIIQKLERSRTWAANTLSESVRLAISLGIKNISVGLEDATRSDSSFLTKLIKTAENAGARRIRLADTVGIASPSTTSRLISEAKSSCSLEIGIHSHNDFGMATANSIAALEAGAHWADATVLGIGERAGNSRLEEMAGFLSLNHKRPYKIEHLRALCHTAAQAANHPIADNHPLVGDAIFTCETGLHLQGLFKNPATYEPYAPELVGGSRKLLIGAKTGKKALIEHIKAMGRSLPEEKTKQAISIVRSLALKNKRALNDEEILAIVNC